MASITTVYRVRQQFPDGAHNRSGYERGILACTERAESMEEINTNGRPVVLASFISRAEAKQAADLLRRFAQTMEAPDA